MSCFNLRETLTVCNHSSGKDLKALQQAYCHTFEALAQFPCQNQGTRCCTGPEQQVWAEPHTLLAQTNAGPACHVPCHTRTVCLPLFPMYLGCSIPNAQRHAKVKSPLVSSHRALKRWPSHTGSVSLHRATRTLMRTGRLLLLSLPATATGGDAQWHKAPGPQQEDESLRLYAE